MTRLVLTWIANSVAILLVSKLMASVHVAAWPDAFAAGAVLSVVNAVVRPALVVLTLPISILTLGLFYFVITAICLRLTAWLIPGFEVHGVIATVVAAMLIGLISMVVYRGLERASR